MRRQLPKEEIKERVQPAIDDIAVLENLLMKPLRYKPYVSGRTLAEMLGKYKKTFNVQEEKRKYEPMHRQLKPLLRPLPFKWDARTAIPERYEKMVRKAEAVERDKFLYAHDGAKVRDGFTYKNVA